MSGARLWGALVQRRETWTDSEWAAWLAGIVEREAAIMDSMDSVDWIGSLSECTAIYNECRALDATIASAPPLPPGGGLTGARIRKAKHDGAHSLTTLAMRCKRAARRREQP